MPGAPQRTVFAEAAKDVLDVDDRVVDHLANSDRESAEGHRVERRAHALQDYDRYQQRERNGGERDESGPEIIKEEHQDDRDQNAAEKKRRADVADSGLNEACRAKQVGMQGDSFGYENGLEIFERSIDAGRNLNCVSSELRRELNDHAGLALNQRGTDSARRRPQDACHVSETHTHTSLVAQNGLSQAVWRDRLTLGTDDDALIPGLDEASTAHSGGSARRREYIVDTDAMSEQQRRIDLDLEFTFSAAVNRDLRDAGHRKQARTKRPVREGPEIHRRASFGSQADRHDRAGRRGQRRHDRRRHTLGHLAGDLQQPLSNHLARLVDVGAISKSNRHHREPLDRT